MALLLGIRVYIKLEEPPFHFARSDGVQSTGGFIALPAIHSDILVPADSQACEQVQLKARFAWHNPTRLRSPAPRTGQSAQHMLWSQAHAGDALQSRSRRLRAAR